MLRLKIGHWEVGETIGRTHIRTDTHRLGNYHIDWADVKICLPEKRKKKSFSTGINQTVLGLCTLTHFRNGHP